MTIAKIIMKQHDGEFTQLISLSKCQVVIVVIKYQTRPALSIKKVRSVLQIMWKSCAISLKCRKICLYVVQFHLSLLECGRFTNAILQQRRYALICNFYWRHSHICNQEIIIVIAVYETILIY